MIDYEKAADVGKNIVERFAAGETDEVYLLYNEFKSVMQQKVTLEKLLPVEPPTEADPFMAAVDYLYEPSAEAILGSILPKHIEVQVYRSMLESQASEMGSRMTAMDSATQERKGHDRTAYAEVQQAAPGRDHQGNLRDRGRSGSAEIKHRKLEI